jgi:hypothetical protein
MLRAVSLLLKAGWNALAEHHDPCCCMAAEAATGGGGGVPLAAGVVAMSCEVVW